MSIESDLNRIATALEELVKNGRGVPVNSPTAAAKVKKEKEVAPAAAAPAATEDLLGIPGVEAPKKHTLEEVHAKLRAYMEKINQTGPGKGIDAAKKVMVKHGASAIKPVVSSIPEANYPALMKELEELSK